MKPDFEAVMSAPFGALGVRTDGERIVEIEFLPPNTPAREPQNLLARRACGQLAAYMSDPDLIFDLPLKSAGTPFQRRVWQAISAIPRGQTLSYGELARRLGTAPRAVGQACGANPYPLVVPCHRVTAASGALGGFAHAHEGWLSDIKRWLLAHEHHTAGR